VQIRSHKKYLSHIYTFTCTKTHKTESRTHEAFSDLKNTRKTQEKHAKKSHTLTTLHMN